MSRNIQDNILLEDSQIKKLLHNATLLGTHKNKKFLTYLFKKKIIRILGTDSISSTSTLTTITQDFFKILDLFEEKYKEQADLGFHYDKDIQEYIPYFKVLYPKFTITNSHGRQHEIRDLFVFHGFKWSNGAVHPYKLEGGRFSKTELEMISGYQQSHLGSNSNWKLNPFYCSKFCVGSDTDVSRMLAEFEVEMNIDRYELFLFCIDSMITWESLEGVPHQKMETIEKAGADLVQRINETYSRDIVKHILVNKIPLDVDFYVAEGLYKIRPNLRASNFIKEIILKKYTFVTAKTMIVSRVPNTFNTYLQMKSPTEQKKAKQTIIAKELYTIFRGRKIYAKVVKEDKRKEITISIDDYIVYPKFLENVITKLESRIYEKAVVKSATQIHNSRNNALRGVTSDTVSM